MPEWGQAVERFEHLHDFGPSPHAFTFKQPYSPDGAMTSIDRDRVKAIAARNAISHVDLLAQVGRIPVR